MNAKLFLILLPALLLSGCVSIGGEMTQKVRSDGTSEVITVYEGVAGSTGGAGTVETWKTQLRNTFAQETITESKWNELLASASGTYHLNTSDPRLAYPGTNPTEEQLDNISQAFMDGVGSYYSDMACSSMTSSGMMPSLKNMTCKISGSDIVVTGIFVPQNVSKYFQKEESFPYITYKYNPMGSVEFMTGSVPGLSSMMDQFGDMFSLNGMLDMATNGSIPDEMKTDISGQIGSIFASAFGGSLGGVSMGYTLEMPGTITNTTVGTLVNNTVKLDVMGLYTNPTIAIVTSQELNPLVYAVGAGVGVVAIGGVALALRKPPKKKAPKKAKVKSAKKKRK